MLMKTGSYLSQQSFKQLDSHFVTVFGTDKIINIAFKNINWVHHSSLDLKVAVTHWNIFLVYLLGADMSCKFCYAVKIITHVWTWKFLTLDRLQRHFIVKHLRIMQELTLAQKFIVSLSALAVRRAVRIYQQLDLILVRKSFKLLEVIVPVIIQHHKLIIIFKLRQQLIPVLDLLYR